MTPYLSPGPLMTCIGVREDPGPAAAAATESVIASGCDAESAWMQVAPKGVVLRVTADGQVRTEWPREETG